MRGIDASVKLINYHKKYDKVKNKLVNSKECKLGISKRKEQAT